MIVKIAQEVTKVVQDQEEVVKEILMKKWIKIHQSINSWIWDINKIKRESFLKCWLEKILFKKGEEQQL